MSAIAMAETERLERMIVDPMLKRRRRNKHGGRSLPPKARTMQEVATNATTSWARPLPALDAQALWFFTRARRVRLSSVLDGRVERHPQTFARLRASVRMVSGLRSRWSGAQQSVWDKQS